MGVATGFTAVRMKKIEDETVVSGHVNQATKELILTTRAGVAIPAGNVEGPQGIQGIQGIVGPAGMPAGTTAQRNTLFGVPVGTPAIVALANKRVVWYNTDLGWFEQYYATTALAGLTVLGLQATIASGWFPIPGNGPRANYVATAVETLNSGSNNVYTKWASTPKYGLNVGGFTAVNGLIKPPVLGVYKSRMSIAVGLGSGTVVAGPYSSKASDWLKLDWRQLSTGFGTAIPYSFLYEHIVSTETVSYRINAGSGINTGNAGGDNWEIEYFSPPFAAS